MGKKKKEKRARADQLDRLDQLDQLDLFGDEVVWVSTVLERRWMRGKRRDLASAQRWLEARIDEGAHCPCCNQFAKIYKRKLNSAMALWLIWLVRRSARPRDCSGLPESVFSAELWQDIREANVRGGDYAKLQHWGFAEQRPNKDRRKRSSGLWRATVSGRRFALGQTTAPGSVYLYDSEPIGFSRTRTDIVQALGERFDYEELMR